jgi:hypothetical protein
MGESLFEDSPGKVSETLSQKWVWWLMPAIPASRQEEGRSLSEASLEQKSERPYLKIDSSKKGWRCGLSCRALAYQL